MVRGSIEDHPATPVAFEDPEGRNAMDAGEVHQGREAARAFAGVETVRGTDGVAVLGDQGTQRLGGERVNEPDAAGAGEGDDGAARAFEPQIVAAGDGAERRLAASGESTLDGFSAGENGGEVGGVEHHEVVVSLEGRMNRDG